MACDNFQPDHNGECLNCDEWWSAHTLPWWFTSCHDRGHDYGILHRPGESIAFCLTCGNSTVIYSTMDRSHF